MNPWVAGNRELEDGWSQQERNLAASLSLRETAGRVWLCHHGLVPDSSSLMGLTTAGRPLWDPYMHLGPHHRSLFSLLIISSVLISSCPWVLPCGCQNTEKVLKRWCLAFSTWSLLPSLCWWWLLWFLWSFGGSSPSRPLVEWIWEFIRVPWESVLIS